MIKKLIRPVLYLLYLLIIVEVTLRFVYANADFTKRLYANEEGYWHREWVRKHRDGGPLAYKMDLFHPQRGWSTKGNYSEQKKQNSENIVTSTNDRGLRGWRNFTYEKRQDQLRILLIGDSFTFGEDVSDKEVFAHQLQEMLPQAEIINMGVHGYAHDQMMLLLKEEGLKYQPDIVIINFLSEDMSRNMLNFRDFAKPKFQVINDQLVRTNPHLPTPEQVIKWAWAKPRIQYLWSYVQYRAQNKSGKYQQQMEEVTRHLLKEMVKSIDSIGSTPVLAFLPYGDQIVDQRDQIPEEDFLFDFCEQEQLDYCFTTRLRFREKTAQGVKFKTKYHYKAPGHVAVAESIYGFLEEEGLLPDSLVEVGGIGDWRRVGD
ncbi:MAG: SGNH/GDSL hydrolase family protein [Bacteroidota bacterium]